MATESDSVQGHYASSKSTSPHQGGIILVEECLEGLAGQGPVPHDVTVVQAKNGNTTVPTARPTPTTTTTTTVCLGYFATQQHILVAAQSLEATLHIRKASFLSIKML